MIMAHGPSSDEPQPVRALRATFVSVSDAAVPATRLGAAADDFGVVRSGPHQEIRVNPVS
jgi:hypothetical protein